MACSTSFNERASLTTSYVTAQKLLVCDEDGKLLQFHAHVGAANLIRFKQIFGPGLHDFAGLNDVAAMGDSRASCTICSTSSTVTPA